MQANLGRHARVVPISLEQPDGPRRLNRAMSVAPE